MPWAPWGELPGLPGEVWVPPCGQGVRVCPPGTVAKGHAIMGSHPVSTVPEGLPRGGGLGKKALWPGSLPLWPLLGFHPAESLVPLHTSPLTQGLSPPSGGWRRVWPLGLALTQAQPALASVVKASLSGLFPRPFLEPGPEGHLAKTNCLPRGMWLSGCFQASAWHACQWCAHGSAAWSPRGGAGQAGPGAGTEGLPGSALPLFK